MKMIIKVFSLVIVLTLIGFAGCSRHKPDSVALQGAWQGSQKGQSQAGDSLTLSGDKLEFHTANGQEWYKGTFTLHEDTNPKQMTVVITDCAAPQYVGKTANAIYRIENGTLTIAAYEPGNAAIPTSFSAQGLRVMDFKMQ